MIGRQLSHYRILEAIGSGGMGTVYRAEDTMLGRPVALKFPHRDVAADAVARERFLREARAASVLDHPNIVIIYDVCEADSEIFIAMQCVEGRPLRERMREGRIDFAEVAAIGRAIADALAHAHNRGVIHRDIKPENVMLGVDGRIKVADFGLARIASETVLTASRVALGTPGYTAPEVLQSKPSDARCDLYSLGVVLYELCAGARPFTGAYDAVLYATVNQQPLPLPAAVPPDLARVVTSLLEKRPEDRPATAAEVADALGRVGQSGPVSGDDSSLRGLRSIAILPFENLTGNPDEAYFCSGMTEEVLTDLLGIPDLRVASRTTVEAMRDRRLDTRQLGRELSVDTVLEGGVRRAGDRIRVTTRLVKADSGFQIWAERYDRRLEDVFEVQEDISRQIARALKVVFGNVPEASAADARLGRRTRSPRAHDLRLRALAAHGRTTEADMRSAIAMLEDAVREDPNYAMAWADLGECCVQMVCKSWDRDPEWLERADRCARQALDLAPQLPDAYRARGHLLIHRRRPDLALRDFVFSAELDPRYSPAQNNLAITYLVMGDPVQAEIHARRAHALDPKRAAPLINLAMILLRTDRGDEARAVAAQALALDPPEVYRLGALDILLCSHAQDGEPADLEPVRAELSALESNPGARAQLALAAALDGRSEDARRLLADPALAENPSTHTLIATARAWSVLGNRDAATETLERALDIEIVALAEVWGDPHLAPLLDDPRLREVRTFTSRST